MRTMHERPPSRAMDSETGKSLDGLLSSGFLCSFDSPVGIMAVHVRSYYVCGRASDDDCQHSLLGIVCEYFQRDTEIQVRALLLGLWARDFFDLAGACIYDGRLCGW